MKRRVLIFVTLAIVIRIALALGHPFLFPDSADYDALARTIVEGKPYQVHGLYASRMPGYPIVIAGIYSLFGYSITAVLLAHALLAGATVWMTYLIGRQFSERAGVVAAALAAFDPLSIAFSASLLTEVPFTFCLVTSLYCCLRLMQKFWTGWWGLLAVLWTVALQLRPEVLGCVLALGLLIVVCGRSWSERALHAGGLVVVLVLMYATVLPWQNRNEKLFDTHVRFTTLEGISLYEAVYPEATGGPRQDVIPLPTDMKVMNEAQRNDEWTRRAWRDIRAQPGRIAWLAVRKIARTWSPMLNAAEFQSPTLQLGLALWYVPLFILAIIGVLRPGISHKIMLLVPILYFTAVHALFLGSVRYRVPLMPLVCLLAAGGIVWLWQRRNGGKPADVSTV